MKILLMLCLMAGIALAQAPPRFVNAQVQTRSSSGSLADQMRELGRGPGPSWVGYTEPSLGGRDSDCGVFYLDDNDHRPAPGEPGRPVAILLRLEQGQVASVRTMSGDCAIDAGGLPVIWLEAVPAEQSQSFLAALVDAAPTENGALAALARTAEVKMLIAIAKSDPTPKVRGQALFWLSQRASAQAVGAISDAIANDPDNQVKERAVFGLSQLPDGQGVPLLIHLAETNPNPVVRKRAMFWLGQSKDPRAVEFFAQVLSQP